MTVESVSDSVITAIWQEPANSPENRQKAKTPQDCPPTSVEVADGLDDRDSDHEHPHGWGWGV